MIVPWQQLAADTLQNLIEEFVTRDGTDYGESEIPLTTRVEQVQRQLHSGEVVIWFDSVTESVTLMTRRDADAAAAVDE